MKFSAKDFFLYFGVIATLYISVISLIILLHQIIDVVYPDQLLTYYDPYSGPIRFAIASLIILFPTFLTLSWLTQRQYRTYPEKHDSGFRRFLIYFTLFITGTVILSNLIMLLNSFLGGEVTTRSLLKVLTLIVIFGLVFGYYLYDMQKKIFTQTTTMWWFEGIAVVLVAGSIIGGFIVMGSPQTQRELRFDTERVTDLSDIQDQIVNYWQNKQTLPQNLSELTDTISGYQVPTDPETNALYEYHATGDLSFQLCATFDNKSSKLLGTSHSSADYPPGTLGPNEQNWQHSVGRTCFDRTIDRQLYKSSKI